MHLVEDNLLGKLYRSCPIGAGKLVCILLFDIYVRSLGMLLGRNLECSKVYHIYYFAEIYRCV